MSSARNSPETAARSRPSRHPPPPRKAAFSLKATTATSLPSGRRFSSHHTVLRVLSHFGPFRFPASARTLRLTTSISFSSVMEALRSRRIATLSPSTRSPSRYRSSPAEGSSTTSDDCAAPASSTDASRASFLSRSRSASRRRESRALCIAARSFSRAPALRSSAAPRRLASPMPSSRALSRSRRACSSERRRSSSGAPASVWCLTMRNSRMAAPRPHAMTSRKVRLNPSVRRRLNGGTLPTC